MSEDQSLHPVQQAWSNYMAHSVAFVRRALLCRFGPCMKMSRMRRLKRLFMTIYLAICAAAQAIAQFWMLHKSL